MEGAPHVPTGDGAIGTPAFPEGEEFFGAGLVFFAVGDGPAFLHAEVMNRQNVRATKAENQKHFDGPGADATNGDEALDELFIGESFGLFEGGDDAFDGFFREVFHREDFCAGKARFAQRSCAEFNHLLRRWNVAVATEGFYATEDCGSGFAGDGLVGDGFEERFVGRLVSFHSELEGAARAYKTGDYGIAAGEMFCCGVEVEGKCRRLIDHGCGPL